MIPKLSSKQLDAAYRQDKWRISLLITWCLLMMAAVLITQEWWRRHHPATSETGQFLQGSLPSFFGASGYVAILFAVHKLCWQAHAGYRWWQSLALAFGIAFFGLTLWEAMRTILHPFDWADVWMSAAGGGFTALVICLLYAIGFHVEKRSQGRAGNAISDHSL